MNITDRALLVNGAVCLVGAAVLAVAIIGLDLDRVGAATIAAVLGVAAATIATYLEDN